MRKNAIKPTVTIGIPAFNEEANIGHLLKSLLLQKSSSCRIVKILVVSDGSTDKTNTIVRSFKQKLVKLLVNKQRLGLNATQNRILNESKSDIVVLFDADILPADNTCVEKLVLPIIKDDTVGLTSGKLYALRVLNLPVGRIIANSHEMKRKMFEGLPNKQNVYLCAGRMRALSKKLYKKLRWPDDVPEDAFSYFFSLKEGLRFVYVPKAVCYFHPPTTLADHIKQNNRFIGGKEALRKYFSNKLLKSHYSLPLVHVLTSTIRITVKHPASIPLYYLMMFYISIFKNRRQDHHSRYEIAMSSKNLKV